MSRARWLILLLALTGAALIYAWSATPRQERLGNRPALTVKPSGVAKSVLPFTPEEIGGGGFAPQQGTSFVRPQRNLFGPLFVPAQIESAPVVKMTPAPAVTVPPSVVVALPSPPTPVGPPPIQPLSVLGHLIKREEQTVFLSTATGQIYLLRQGDLFADNLVVKDLTSNAVTIGRKGSSQQVVLSLGETKSQRLPSLKTQSDRPSVEAIEKQIELEQKGSTAEITGLPPEPDGADPDDVEP